MATPSKFQITGTASATASASIPATVSTSAPATNDTAVSAVVPVPTHNYVEKPEKFDGTDFQQWQLKMRFFLTTLGLAKFLVETVPIMRNDGDTMSFAAVEAWKHSDYICKNHILNSLDKILYKIYCKVETSKELWESLEKKYKTENAGKKKFVVSKFLKYEMVDSKSVVSQAEELQLIF